MSNRAGQPEQIARRRRIPTATYRLQFNRDFTLAQATEAAPYLRDLGISDCYASPLFQAGPQSTHGYDVCRFDEFNPAIGTRQDLATWSARLHELGLGLILDMVPNHMGADLSNRWWADVLRRGRDSPFADYFDIDWQPRQSDLHDKILLPTLEDHYAAVLEAGRLRLTCQGGVFSLAYYDRLFPIVPRSVLALLEKVAAAMEERPAQASIKKELSDLLEQLRQRDDSPELAALDDARLQSRIEDFDHCSPAFHQALEVVCGQYHGQPGEPRSFDELHALVRDQHYRLAFWQVGSEEINYRRFFDVTELVSLRMELPLVFQACHQLVFELLQQGRLSGLRIDHPDGLLDPKEYFRRLQASFLRTQMDPTATANENEELEGEISEWLAERLFGLEQHELEKRLPWPVGESKANPLTGAPTHPVWPLYIVAEKILTGSEPLRRDWPVDGTTGYDFLNQVNGLFIDATQKGAFDALYHEFTGLGTSFRDTVYSGKKRILDHSLISELDSLAHRLKALAEKTRYGQDLSLRQLKMALVEVIATFPVYRTYVAPDTAQVIPREQSYIEAAVREAKARQPDLDHLVFDFIQDLLLLHSPPDFDDEARQLSRDFVLRCQQLTGPVMAKGQEDTAFYRHTRLVSLNEVGGNPDQFGISLKAFHDYSRAQAESWPHTLLATATHDTKRGEDVRARLNVLSEIPAEWRTAIQRWSRLNASQRTSLDGQTAPDPNDEYLLYQTLVGAWPWEDVQDHSDPVNFRERIVAYMLKAVREAKVHATWTDPNSAYEQATRQFTERILDPAISSQFLEDFRPFQRKVAFFGAVNSLAQVLLKITCPGVPDFYQGTELWDLSLVDPDNRRPVDYPQRRRLLNELQTAWAKGPHARPELLRQLLRNTSTGQVKLHLVWRALALRQRLQSVFSDGEYVPLRTLGSKQDHVCAFARIQGEQVTLTVVPRLVVRLTELVEQWPHGDSVWQDTVIELTSACLAGRYTNALTGEEVKLDSGAKGPMLPVSVALASFPVALLERTRNGPY